ncbi:MAG: EF-P lysine aminoacylase EpmA [Sulfuricaulis sp.]
MSTSRAPETAKHLASGDWRPTATLEVLRLRARLLARIRAFFSERDVLEVETPILSAAAVTDPALASMATHYLGPVFPHGLPVYLQTSPEFPMKRLLAAGSGSIYQICKTFRDGEAGRLHNPEFTMLEWYRVGFDHHRLMAETSELIRQLLVPPISLEQTEYLTYGEAFRRHAGIDPHMAGAEDFAAVAKTHQIQAPQDLLAQNDLSIWRDLLLTHVVEPKLGEGQLTFIYDYPAAQASLARILPGNPPVAARFEVYLNGIELANGFHELADPVEQRTRFERQLHTRAANGLPDVPIDERLLTALALGLPDCAGVALGVDRLVMLAAGAHTIAEVIAFPVDRA